MPMVFCRCLHSNAFSDVEKDQSQNMEASVEQMKKIIGEPRNYGKTVMIFLMAQSAVC